MPFTGDSSDDSSDGEDCPNHSHASQSQPATRATSSSEDTSISGGSNSSPLKTCSLLPSKNRGKLKIQPKWMMLLYKGRKWLNLFVETDFCDEQTG